ncbi:MAG: tetratricopeptide repeat protein [Candidatus Hydrogenedentes bacterium]|nr:tetratricopeptide repeat protein [Candidatus Hydrogenedentota bacterium]
MSDSDKHALRLGRNDILIGLALACAIAAAFGGVVRSGFIEYDDSDYVTKNPHVQAGLSRDGVVWAFTTLKSSNWHPLTWLSLMADTSVYNPDALERGPNPFGHHLTNLVLHIANSILLYLAALFMTGARGRSAFVAALFALHPLHVESVAWIAERKDVLSTLFWMLTLLAYAWYVRRPSVFRYSAVFLALSLGLLAKPMLVTLPCVLLLLDYWPLNRFASAQSSFFSRLHELAREKLPLFALAAASCFATVYAQNGAMPNLHQLPISYRLANAALSYLLYIGKMFYPAGLAVHYPHAVKETPLALAVVAAAALGVITCVAVLTAKRRPYLITGWLWYLGTLVPVIGLVQVGSQALADRYTYVPLIGLFVVISWGAADLADWKPAWRAPLSGAGLALLLVAALATRQQVSYWRTNDILFARVLEVTGDNVVAHDALGLSALARGDVTAANFHFGESLRIRPDLIVTLDNYGVTLTKLGKHDEAIAKFRRALELDPSCADAQNHWGRALFEMRRLDDAVMHYQEALKLDPEYAEALDNMGMALLAQRKPVEAVAYLSKAIAFAPRQAGYHLDLAVALDIRGDTEAAIEHAREANRLDPSFIKAREFLRTLHAEP